MIFCFLKITVVLTPKPEKEQKCAQSRGCHMQVWPSGKQKVACESCMPHSAVQPETSLLSRLGLIGVRVVHYYRVPTVPADQSLPRWLHPSLLKCAVRYWLNSLSGPMDPRTTKPRADPC